MGIPFFSSLLDELETENQELQEENESLQDRLDQAIDILSPDDEEEEETEEGE